MMFLCVYVYTPEGRCHRSSEQGAKSLGSGITSSYVNARNWTGSSATALSLEPSLQLRILFLE